MTQEEKVACSAYLDNRDNDRTCNEYRLLKELLYSQMPSPKSKRLKIRYEPTEYGSRGVYQACLDLSKIASTSIFFDSDYGPELYWVDANCNNIAWIPTSNSNNIQVPSGAKGIKIGSARVANFQITSFTSTDGRVHTASNLNY